MQMEIERKYRIHALGGLELGKGLAIDQGYIVEGPPTVRVRTKGKRGFLTLKFDPSKDERKVAGAIVKAEYEFEIPLEEARSILERCPLRLQKTRYILASGLEIDIFEGRHQGLIMAEFESPDGSAPACPEGVHWTEVTRDRRYANSWIALHGIPKEKQ